MTRPSLNGREESVEVQLGRSTNMYVNSDDDTVDSRRALYK